MAKTNRVVFYKVDSISTSIAYLTGIYCMENIVTNKVYIGSSCHIGRRIHQHTNLLNRGEHYNKHFQNGWNKYGKENFIIFVIQECSIDQLLELEQKWLDTYLDFSKVYNQSLDVKRPAVGIKVSEETRKKRSIANTGKIQSPETRVKISLLQRRKADLNCKDYYEFLDPSGKYTAVYDLLDFCRNMGLHPKSMRRVHNKTRNTHKGWTKYEN